MKGRVVEVETPGYGVKMHDGLAPAAGSVSRDAETPVEVRKNRFLTLTLGSIGVV